MLITPALEPVFQSAGWYRGRRKEVPDYIPKSHPAAGILAEFGGISLLQQGDDKDRLTLIDFELLEETDILAKSWEAELNSQLFGVGELHNRHGELYVDAKGRLFGNSIIHEAFWFIGMTFEKGMVEIISGARSRPMLLRDQRVVTLYGLNFTHDDPEVLTAASLDALTDQALE